MSAGPAAGSDAAFAFREDGIRVADLEDALVRAVGDFDDAQGKE